MFLWMQRMWLTGCWAVCPCRQICAPFTLALRHLQLKAGGLDTRLIVPDVDVAITSRDFQALNDIINMTGLAPVSTLVFI